MNGSDSVTVMLVNHRSDKAMWVLGVDIGTTSMKMGVFRLTR